MKKKLRISFNGKTYDVVAEILDDDQAQRDVEPGFAAASNTAAAATAAAAIALPAAESATAARQASGNGDLPSPMAGKVVSIDVSPGATVKAGQPVVTLEAMKMNTSVAATRDGTVVAIHVHAGDFVEEGQLLITLR